MGAGNNLPRTLLENKKNWGKNMAQISNIQANGVVVANDDRRKYLAISNISGGEAFLSIGTTVVATLGSGIKLNKSGVANDRIVFEGSQATNLINVAGTAGIVDLAVLEI